MFGKGVGMHLIGIKMEGSEMLRSGGHVEQCDNQGFIGRDVWWLRRVLRRLIYLLHRGGRHG